MAYLSIVGGLMLLVAGAELLVRGASRLAGALGVSPLVIGLTVVAFGTSAPEMAVSLSAALEGRDGLALGNAAGSNIFNVLFILGVSAAVTPLSVSLQLIRREVPIMIGVSLLTYGMAYGGLISRFEGVLLFAGIVAYTVYQIRGARRGRQETPEAFGAEYGAPAGGGGRPAWLSLVPVAAGLALLVAGARLLVHGSVLVAQAFGVSELVIGLTVAAAGTSLPEVATSVAAAIRGERDIAVGNVVGSNIFNLLAVLGLAAAAAPDGLAVAESALRFDLPAMIASSALCLPIFLTGHAISRWEGFAFLAGYAAYLAYLIRAAGAG